MSSQYNSRPRPAVVAVDGGETRLAARRETLTDLTRLETGGPNADDGSGGVEPDDRADRGCQVDEAAGTGMTDDAGSADGGDEPW